MCLAFLLATPGCEVSRHAQPVTLRIEVCPLKAECAWVWRSIEFLKDIREHVLRVDYSFAKNYVTKW